VATAAAASQVAGTMTFTANGKPIKGCTRISIDAAPTQPVICHATFRAASHPLAAYFTPTAGTFVQASTSAQVSLTVSRLATHLALTSGRSATLGSRFTYRARLTPSASGALAASGRITFEDGGKTIPGCAHAPLSKGIASCPVTYDGLASHTITASYAGNRNFAPAHTPVNHVAVKPESPRGVVNAFMSWTFAYGPTSTGVRSLTISGLAKGTEITLLCHGAGCAFSQHIATLAHHHGRSLNLTPLFRHRRLHAGATLVVRVSHANWLGKYYRFTIRRGRKPALLESCLAAGGTRPSVGCSAR
jgi:hypothetical protein